MRQFIIFITVLVFSIVHLSVFAKETPLLLVGGGTETKNGWSDQPYQWFVEQSSNKKVAIISYANVEDNWLRDYFISLGALEAKDFKIGRNEANNQALIEELQGYTAFFFKGGDQNKYYSYYKNSLFFDLLNSKINQGCVLGGTSAGMAILSSIVFTAENGSIYPEDGLKNMSSKYFTLEDDFIDVLSNTIADTHFAERGRLPRLISMLAYWEKHQNAQGTLGVGVDDKTALCIDTNGIGTVYGTGATSFVYLNKQTNHQEQSPLHLKDISVISCVHHQQFDIKNKSKLNDKEAIEAIPVSAPYNNAISLISNGNHEEIIQSENSQTVVVFDSRKQTLSNNYGNHVYLFDISTIASMELSSMKAFFESTKRVIVLPFESSLIDDFTEEGNVLNWVYELIKSSQTEVFIFDGAIPFVGSYYATNEKSKDDAAYKGALNYASGLDLIGNTILTNAIFKNSSFNENTLAVLQEGMLSLNMDKAIGLPQYSTLKIYTDGEQSIADYQGRSSAIILKNKSNGYTKANRKRNIVGFNHISANIIYNDTISFSVAGDEYQPNFKDVINSSTIKKRNRLGMYLFQSKLIFARTYQRSFQLFNCQGQTIVCFESNSKEVNLPSTTSNPLIVRVTDVQSGTTEFIRICHN